MGVGFSAMCSAAFLIWSTASRLPQGIASILLDVANGLLVKLLSLNSTKPAKGRRCGSLRKDHLKARGYRWSDGSDGCPKSWWIEVGDEALDDKLHYLSRR
jgi:hypothetical protein